MVYQNQISSLNLVHIRLAKVAQYFTQYLIKQQNDRELWNMIDSSFMTTLPDSWAINQRFILLPVNRWEADYQRVFLGGLTCDSQDYYNDEAHTNAVFYPNLIKMIRFILDSSIPVLIRNH